MQSERSSVVGWEWSVLAGFAVLHALSSKWSLWIGWASFWICPKHSSIVRKDQVAVLYKVMQEPYLVHVTMSIILNFAGSASEAILVAALTAREQAVQRLKAKHPDWSESDIRGKLVMYSSDQSNSCVEKSALLAAVPIRLLPADEEQCLRGDTLRTAIEADIEMGKIPICFIATHGTTGTCAFDNLLEIGPICQEYKIWLHIDAAYAGSALCCPEFRPLMQGIEYADSFNFNLHKWMMVNFDCCAMWFKDADQVVDAFNVDRIYLKHQFQGESKAPDYRHWQIPLGRRFRALKVWITLRTIGTENIRQRIRKHTELAKRFEQKVRSDARFEIVAKPILGLVCFRLKGDCDKTQQLLDRIGDRKKIYVIPAKCNGKLMIRFVVCGHNPEERDIDFAWNEITSSIPSAQQSSKIEMLSTHFASKVEICSNSSDKTPTI